MDMGSDKENPANGQNASSVPKNYEITVEGSLGLLALGAAGIRAWRKKRAEAKQDHKTGTGNE